MNWSLRMDDKRGPCRGPVQKTSEGKVLSIGGEKVERLSGGKNRGFVTVRGSRLGRDTGSTPLCKVTRVM